MTQKETGMAKALDKLSADELSAEIDAVDALVGEQGATIERARKAQRKHLDRKDDLVNALNDRLRADGANITLGADGG